MNKKIVIVALSFLFLNVGNMYSMQTFALGSVITRMYDDESCKDKIEDLYMNLDLYINFAYLFHKYGAQGARIFKNRNIDFDNYITVYLNCVENAIKAISRIKWSYDQGSDESLNAKQRFLSQRELSEAKMYLRNALDAAIKNGKEEQMIETSFDEIYYCKKLGEGRLLCTKPDGSKERIFMNYDAVKKELEMILIGIRLKMGETVSTEE